LLGQLLGTGWREVGEFLRGSIIDFHHSHPNLAGLFEDAGWSDVRIQPLTFSAGLVMWARKK
jgi:demethylmenaquinone methyltransferase/2-methoxy-6-polyprenyl-1,4-benzoquinol methylase